METIPEVPVNVGATELKQIVFYLLLPRFLKWSKNYGLTIDDCELRTKQWVELIPRYPDVNAIANQFFVTKGKSTVKTFAAKQGAELFLVISHETYVDILDTIERSANSNTDALPNVCSFFI